MAFELRHLGGEKTVTGSCHLLRCKGLNILVDCGMAQGGDRVVAMEEWPVPPADIHYLLLTHAHLDHIGGIPDLIQLGFQGEIIATHATVSLLEPMLRDAMRVQGLPSRNLETLQQKITQQAWGFEYGVTFDLRNGVRFKLGRAGHILGSCFIRLEWAEPDYSIVFSGDLGCTDTPLLHDPDPVQDCNLLVMESTYGDRLHENRRERIQQLGKVLSRALSDNGKVFIPAFALGRTQELLYEIDRLRSDPQLCREFSLPADKDIPVVIDTPLGLELTSLYQQLAPYWDKEARDLLNRGDNPLDFAGLYRAEKYRDHQRLVEMDGPCVIMPVAACAMAGALSTIFLPDYMTNATILSLSVTRHTALRAGISLSMPTSRAVM